MKTYFRIAACGFVFSFVAFVLEEWLCHVIIGRCTSTGDVSFFTMLVPNLILFGLYFLVGVGTALLSERIVVIATLATPTSRFLLRLMTSGTIGWVVSSLATVILGGSSIADGFTNVVTNFPFTFGGIICAVVPSAHPPSGSKAPDG